MSREILFRGKRLDNGGWETGSLIIIRWGCSDARHYITDKMTGYPTPIDPATVAQFTGLCDKNGVKIFEGDILQADYNELKMTVYFKNKLASFALKNEVWMYPHYFGEAVNAEDCEVVGSIHDNKLGREAE